MSVDIDIYMTQFKGFFNKNPEQLTILIGNIDPETFFDGIRSIVEGNSQKEDSPIEPTRQQILTLIVDLNGGPKEKVEKRLIPFMKHHMGTICLN
jgi:hypothetical protein